ncbi:MAG TPA: hypothetical protein PLY94_12320, partial [Gemmatimonadaceae bacterium]|nr:hypothetical protein [Gemmatimonadaceae bacterium]
AIARSILRASSSPNAAGARANLIAALGGNAGPLAAAMGGSAQATALAQAIAALGPNPSASSVINAIQAYNAYLDAIAGTSVSATSTANAAAVQELLEKLGAMRVAAGR